MVSLFMAQLLRCIQLEFITGSILHPRHDLLLHGAPSFADARATCTACTPWRSLPSPGRGHDATTCSLRCCPRFYACYKTCSDKQLANAPNRHGYNLNCHGYMRMLQHQRPPRRERARERPAKPAASAAPRRARIKSRPAGGQARTALWGRSRVLLARRISG